jgi:hypothetical protein
MLLQYRVKTRRVTSMANTGIDAVKKQKNAEYAKQYRLKRKFQMQQQASSSSETESAPSKRRSGGAYEDEDDEIFDFIVVQPKNM